MTVALPYEFDTTTPFRRVLQIMLGLLLIALVPGILYSIAVGHLVTVLQLTITAAILGWFIHLLLRHGSGSRGTITRDAVSVAPGRVLGMRMRGPSGRFPVQQFRAIRVEHVSGPSSPDVQGGPHERVYLAGKPGTPDILVARTDRHDSAGGEEVGRALCALLALPYEATRAPR